MVRHFNSCVQILYIKKSEQIWASISSCLYHVERVIGSCEFESLLAYTIIIRIDSNVFIEINGIIYYRYLCKTCYQKSKDQRRNKIKQWLKDYKKTLSCNRCGNSDYRVLQFHHLKDKHFDIGDFGRKSISTIQKEISKCEVLCANCHMIEHYKE